MLVPENEAVSLGNEPFSVAERSSRRDKVDKASYLIKSACGTHGGRIKFFRFRVEVQSSQEGRGKVIYRLLSSFVCFNFLRNINLLVVFSGDDSSSSRRSHFILPGIRFLHLVVNLLLHGVVCCVCFPFPSFFLVSIRAMDNKSVTLKRDNHPEKRCVKECGRD